MGRRRAKFSKESLKRFLNIAEYNDSLFDSEIKNLEVRKRKTPSPHLSFITQMKIKGETKPTSFKLGSYPEHDINEIRFKYQEYRKLCLDGINPKTVFERKKQEELEAKTLAKQRKMSLEDTFKMYLSENTHIQPVTRKDMTNCLQKNCNGLLKKSIATITSRELEQKINTIYKEGKIATALNLFGYLNTIFNYATGVLIDENDTYLLTLNPLNKLLNLRKKIKKSLPVRKAIEISPALIRKLFDEARISDHPEYNGVFKNREYIFNLIHLILFTGLRLHEACSLKWEHINLDDNPEDFKPAHMLVYGLKGDQDQSKKYRSIIPLTKYLKTILNNQYKYSGQISQWVFPSNNGRDALKGDDSKPMNSPRKNIERVARHIGHPFSLHELRHLFASVGASIGHPEDVIKRLLHHGISSITQRYIHNIVSKSIKVYEEIHEEMLRIWDVNFFDGK